MKDSLNRRTFLKQAGAAGIGVGLAGLLRPAARGASLAGQPSLDAIGANKKISALRRPLVLKFDCILQRFLRRALFVA